MKSLLMLAPVAFGLAMAGAAPAQAAKRGATCAKATPALLDAKFAEFNAAWATKNPDTVTALFDDDAVLLPPWPMCRAPTMPASATISSAF